MVAKHAHLENLHIPFPPNGYRLCLRSGDCGAEIDEALFFVEGEETGGMGGWEGVSKYIR